MMVCCLQHSEINAFPLSLFIPLQSRARKSLYCPCLYLEPIRCPHSGPWTGKSLCCPAGVHMNSRSFQPQSSNRLGLVLRLTGLRLLALLGSPVPSASLLCLSGIFGESLSGTVYSTATEPCYELVSPNLSCRCRRIPDIFPWCTRISNFLSLES